MARTPLFRFVRRSMQIAAVAAKSDPVLADEMIHRITEKELAPTRRDFLKVSALAGASLATPDLFAMLAGDTSAKPRVGIVGAGVAGLNCAYKLKKAGIMAQVFEASGRTGGRMLTAKDLLAPGLTTEMGGEFIDSGHDEMLALVKEFKLSLYDFEKLASMTRQPEAFFFDGVHRTEAQVVKEFIPLARQIAKDADSLGEEVSYRDHGNGQALDRMSITHYLDKIGARGWIRDLLEVAYVTEYGLEADQQSSINLIFLIGTDTEDGFAPFGDSDERYTVKGGNQRVVDELAKRVQDSIQMRHKLVAIAAKGSGYVLTFDSGGKTVDRTFDSVVLTLPFTMLREVDIRLPLPEVKRRAIKELGYGNNAKVLAGFKSRKWRALGYGGNTLSDEPFQLCWDNAALQPGTQSGITFYSGGTRALDAGKGTSKEALETYLPGFERAYPGSRALLNGKVSRIHWPTNPFVKAAYACYKPGQWTTIGGAEGESVGNLHFAGEHTSVDFQGYMNGGAQSGADAAKAVLESVSAKAAELFRRSPRLRVS